MKSSEIRRRFLDYFKNKNHTIVSSSSLVPGNDPTLLFTNAGMVQFKDVFLGTDKRPYNRAVTAQRCVRAGGKHNDLENVGYTARHHTFFEMLGNFSFGDYFKREAIHFAWEFLTKELGLPKEKLWVTVFNEDQEAADIWLNEIKVDPNRLSRIGAKDNFWAMGDTGPCGPCSEIFYDHGDNIWGGPPGSPEEDGDRYIEIWNLVFMQYNRSADGTLTPLPKPSVDTGMGLERLAAVLQGVHNNYDTDLFIPLIKAAAKLANCHDLQNQSLRVISDHLRSSSFLIADGVRPSNEGRGYVLRRIIRRALRHGYKLGMDQFFYKLVPMLVAEMGEAYPELKARQKEIEHALKVEEEQFSRTLSQGMKLLQEAINEAKALQQSQLLGATVFKLYDTYGFPVDLTADIIKEHQLSVDEAGFEIEMNKQRELSKAASKFGEAYTGKLTLQESSDFHGYEHLHVNAEITSLYQGENSLAELKEGERGVIVLNATPFYAESGGQVGDRGILKNSQAEFVVEDTQKAGNAIAHHGYVAQGKFKVGEKLTAEVDEAARLATALNHSATHLLHAAMQKILGSHVEQKGSLVEPARLRFDFTHPEPVSFEQLQQIEQLVNQEIRLNHAVATDIMSPDEAIQQGAMALFGEKYGDKVRVLTMGKFSKELCGGTHVKATGDIGLFKIISESGIAAGIRRVEAITGQAALDYLQQQENLLRDITAQLKSNRANIVDRIQQQLQTTKALEKQVEQLQQTLIRAERDQWRAQAKTHALGHYLIAEVAFDDAKQLRTLAEQLRDSFDDVALFLAAKTGERVSVITVVKGRFSEKLAAGTWLNQTMQAVGGKGGGRNDFAQAAFADASQIAKALSTAEGLL